ncbi:nuclear transport factor 2 family protein [Aureibaculum sp. 2210JD6-5]|uniref:nuclear transport factor 2 family protein n=1 Tax=Aureibaculum sp. 2210JD6-5 TaxID=3103957 RepID=UPI002AAF011A|nr:nuclear transport factor 2 family protein [Aureibaculum sp. 2210JD6-5]MDY7395098.1 nuclear transport factor 2 family protein [Aureibaculum sp. 2210JD6-5]
MKKLILLGFAIILFTACGKPEQRYTQQSPEIETVKTLINNYNTKNYDTSIYADTSQTFYNSNSKKGLSPDETIKYHKQNDENYSSRGFSDKDPEYEMVVTDEGNTWVNCWLGWKGTLAGNDKEIEIPIHLTYQFIDGKIVREHGYWDPTEVVLNLQAIEAEKNNSASEEKNEATE